MLNIIIVDVKAKKSPCLLFKSQIRFQFESVFNIKMCEVIIYSKVEKTEGKNVLTYSNCDSTIREFALRYAVKPRRTSR
jgi:hypothetical protein